MYKPYTVWAADFLQRTHTLQSSHLSSFLVVAQVEKPMKTLFPITDAYKKQADNSSTSQLLTLGRQASKITVSRVTTVHNP